METLPEFWRTEIWHPLSVHFPIVLVLVALVFKGLGIRNSNNSWNTAGSLLLYLATVSAWIAIYTGDLADGIVSRKICDPTVLKDHENAAYILGWLVLSASIIDVLLLTVLLRVRQFVFKSIVFLLLLVGSGYVIYTGHSGASLVYQQGAGVYHPTDDCDGF